MRTILFCLCCLILLITLPTFAQDAQLSGLITDTSKAAVSGAKLSIANKDTGVTRSAESNSDGYYSAPALPAGTYMITVQVKGFRTAVADNIKLDVAQRARLDFTLEVGDIQQTITVEGAPLVNTESAVVGTVVDRQFAENIPLNGRSFQTLITLTPGVVTVPASSGLSSGQFSVNGQRASGNSFTVDGVSGNIGTDPGTTPNNQTSGNLPGLTTFGSTQSLVSIDALQEFKVQTSSYSAEYGRQPGGQISIVTRSGTNRLHGSAFDYLRNDLFDANNWFSNRDGLGRPKERQNDFGGTFGGPVLIPGLYNGHDRTFFFFSYEGLRLRQPLFSLTNVPTLSLRQTAPPGVQPILSAFPLPNGRDLGNGLAEFTANYSDPASLNATSIRVDHTVSSKLTLFGRYNNAPSESVQRQAPRNLSGTRHRKIGTQTLTLSVTASLTPRISNEFRANYSNNYGNSSFAQDNFGGASPLPRNVLIPSQYDSSTANGTILFVLPGGTSGSFPSLTIINKQLTTQRQFNVVDNLSYSLGAHQLKFGVDYRRLTPVRAVNAYTLSTTFLSLQNVSNSSAASGFIGAQVGELRPQYLNFSAYGQDTWKLSRRVTFNFGVRWEVNPAPTEANGNDPLAVTSVDNLSTMQLAPRGTKLWKTTYNNFAPRIGAAYQLSQHPSREMVLRGGFGLYYDTGNDQSSAPFNSFPFAGNKVISNVAYPLSAIQVAPAPIPALQPSLTPPFGTISAFDPSLKLPYTLHWNVAVEQAVGKSQAVTVSYVGAVGRRLLQDSQLNLSAINPSFTTVVLTRNSARSNYEALQAQFQRRLSRGLQALVSYTWSHALDDDSSSFSMRVTQHGNADFDVRHVFAAAATYDIPAPGTSLFARAVLGHWSIDTSVHAQSGLPVDLVASTLTNPADGSLVNVRPNVNPGVPFYVDDPRVPGGRKINAAAFSLPQAGQSGNFGRNQVRGLPAWQIDLATRREFKLTEKLKLQFRAEAFNIFNHPNFGTIQTSLTAANFGQATNMLNSQLGGLSSLYQIGGPRSFQFAVKIIF